MRPASWCCRQRATESAPGGELEMKMISLALLSIAAIPAATIGARADELTALKKQIDALGARVSGIEAEPLPGATSEAVTVRRGQGAYLTAPERAADRV